MIINGGSRRNSTFFAKHLANAEHNERVTLCELRNLAAQDIAGALREMAAVALGTRCENFFYHANINPREDEQLSAEQWQIAANTLEEYLGLKNHARFMVEHQKLGRTHRHVIWSRIDIRRMVAVAMTDDYEKHQAVARKLEEEFNLERGTNILDRGRACGPRPPRRPKTWESFRGQQSGIDPVEMTRTITALYRASKTGRQFAAALETRGYELVKGDRSDFCIVDGVGHLHSLARRVAGIDAQSLRRFMKDVSVVSPL